MFIFPMRLVMRALINLGHNLIIILLVLAIYRTANLLGGLLAIAGLAVVLLNVAWVGTLAGIISARFRDVPQIVGAMMQFSMFMTPVFWKPDQVGRRHMLLELNPFYYMLDIVRSPLLGGMMNPKTWPVLSIMAVLGWILAFSVFTGTRRRIVHYL